MERRLTKIGLNTLLSASRRQVNPTDFRPNWRSELGLEKRGKRN